MNTIETVMLCVSVLATLTKFAGVTKEFWTKVPAFAHYVPGALMVATLVGEKLAGVQTSADLVNAGVALGLLALGHFTKPAEVTTK